MKAVADCCFTKCRPWGCPKQEPRFDRDGVGWYACDPYPHWFRRDGDMLIVLGWAPVGYFADEPMPTKPVPCHPHSCRLDSWSNYCKCQGWCL